MMKLLITGAHGLLGSRLAGRLSSYYELLLTDLDAQPLLKTDLPYMPLDITDYTELKRLFTDYKPDIVVNCASYTDVDGCERYEDKAFQVNTWAVEYLVDLAQKRRSFLVHFSTDYVFDGKAGPYSEDDTPDPINVYGRSKLESERILETYGRDHLIIRTNVLFGNAPRRVASFVEWVCGELTAGRRIRVVDDQYNNPTWSDSLAEAVTLALQKGLEGLFHFGGADYLNRFQFAGMIADVWGLKKNLISPIKTEELKQLAPRPLRGGLKTIKIEQEASILPMPLRTALKEMKAQDG